jgi:acyl-CoA reductase-like NAD-dependent aldehyde dehydrogenase
MYCGQTHIGARIGRRQVCPTGVGKGQAAEVFENRVFDAEKKGAKILYHPGSKGALLPPIVVDYVPHDGDLVMEETFGPIVPIVRVPDNDQEVMDISNSTDFGLSSGDCLYQRFGRRHLQCLGTAGVTD